MNDLVWGIASLLVLFNIWSTWMWESGLFIQSFDILLMRVINENGMNNTHCNPFKSASKIKDWLGLVFHSKAAKSTARGRNALKITKFPFFRQLSTKLSIQVRIFLLSKVLRCTVTFFGRTSNSNLSYGQIHISHGGPSWFNHLRFGRSPSIELLRKQAHTCSRLREPTIIKFLQNHHHFYFTRLCLPFQSSWFK